MSKKKDSFKPWLSRPAVNRSVTLPLTRPLTQRLSNLNEFHPNELDPYLLFDARDSMLDAALETASFLEPVPVLRNLARGSQKGGDAEQAVALNQPKALPLAANGKGYCYLPVTTGNAPAVTFPTIGANDDFVLEMDVYLVDVDFFHLVSGSSTSNRIIVFNNGANFQFNLNSVNQGTLTSPINAGASTITCERTNGTFFLKQDGVTKGTIANASGNGDFSHLSFNGQFTTSVHPLNGYIQKATLSIEGTEEFNCDFTATNVRHGDTKFTCSTGQVVTINQDFSSSNDVATIIKKPVLRFDGVDDFMDGVFGQTLSSGYLFAAFSVLGDGGSSWVRLFSTNPTGGTDASGSMLVRRYSGEDAFRVRYDAAGSIIHDGMYDSARGDMLLDVSIANGSQTSFINNADEENKTLSGTVSVDDFVLASRKEGDFNMPVDLEYLALFPASITDEQADAVRNYINNRNNVFDLKDGFGYYFFDPQSLADGAVTSWNGRIIGSDNGDVDKLATQATAADQPTSDGYKVTFADATDHLEIPSTTQAGWQVVGSSLGTFAYKVNANAVTELNLLGNLGSTAYRQAGQSYGMILLPESATGAEIEAARKLLIDRGAADGTTPTSLYNFWRNRADIVEFKHINTSSVTSYFRAWRGCSSLTSFPLLDHNNAADFREAFQDASSLQSFPAIQAPLCTNFSYAWKGCSALTSFPAGAKLGTSAQNVNFSSAWQQSGLTSFSTPLPTATSAAGSWANCTSLKSFNTELPSVTNASSAWYGCSSLESFSSELPLGRYLGNAWYNCSSLTDFSADVFSNWNPSSIYNGVFDGTWVNCTSLTAQSVENILVSIDASGKYGTATGASGGSALADATIDIDYNVATGSLTAATLSAIETLNGRGWSVNINNEIIVPNILQLQPAAAYSLRSFDADADPTVVNVRRSSDGALSDFTASQVSDGTLTDWVGAGNDGHVTTWYDQGGTNHATQSTASNQPKIVDGGVLVTGGLDFDGASSSMDINGLVIESTEYYMTAVIDLDFIPNNALQTIFDCSDEQNAGAALAYSNNGLQLTPFMFDGDDTSVNVFSGGANLTTDKTLVGCQFKSGASESYINGGVNSTLSNTWTSAGTNTFTKSTIGYDQSIGGRNINGKLAELLVYESDQSANRTGIENNINDHFNIYS